MTKKVNNTVFIWRDFIVILPKRNLPEQYSKRTNQISHQTESLPFYIKECGFCNEKKFVLGNANNYYDYILLYSVSGVVRFTKNQSTQYIYQDNVVISSCNTPLTFTRASNNWEYFYMIIRGTHAKLYYNLVRNKSSIIPTDRLSSILDLFLEMHQITFKKEVLDDMQASLIIHNIFFELYKISNSILETKKITPVQETVVNLSLKYIANNYKNDLDVDTICNEVSFSKYYFCKLFKDHMGMTIHQYVNEYRVNKSKELLTYSKLSINAIAKSVGFKSTLTYSRCFERFTHMTPSEYRKNF